ncbi:MAG: carbonic anhydrase [Planctomycetota bacterium]|nr:carbonic anhydrase [Planctomycetota bacterium]
MLNQSFSRRNLFTAAATTGAAVSLLHRSDLFAAEPPKIDFSKLSPAESLVKLFEGNKRFVAGEIRAPRRDIERLREVAPTQKPFAAILGCADSRVPVEIVFDQGFGDLFVTRIAGNVASTENIASLEFGTEILGAKVILVLGHTNCGAVVATASARAVPGQISALYQLIRPAIRSAKGDVVKAIYENVKLQVQTLSEASPVLAERIAKGQLVMAGGVFDLETGIVHPVELPGVST